MRDVTIRPEIAADEDAIAHLHLAAFGEAILPVLVAELRRQDAAFPTQSFVACDALGEIVGHVMLSHSWLDAPDRMIDVLVLSPLGVAPHMQRKGVGKALLAHAIEKARETAAPILILEGDPAYYKPRGFEPAAAHGILRPSLRIPEPALQMIRLPSYASDMVGMLVYRDVFWRNDCVGLRDIA